MDAVPKLAGRPVAAGESWADMVVHRIPRYARVSLTISHELQMGAGRHRRTGQVMVEQQFDELDDQHDGSGRRLFRLHGPGRSAGCITACNLDNWIPIFDFVNTSSTTFVPATVNTYYGPSLGGWQLFGRIWTGTETLQRYGRIVVID